MAIQLIDLGASANNGLGDKLRIGGDKINDNFQKLSDKVLTGTFQIVHLLSDLPTPVANIITLSDNTTYYFITSVDLLGNSLVFGTNTCILGTSDLNSKIYSSTALSSALLQCDNSTDIRNIKIDSGIYPTISFGGNASTDNVFFENAVFENCDLLGGIQNYKNVKFIGCSFENSAVLNFDLTIENLRFDNCKMASISQLITIESTAIINSFKVNNSDCYATGTDVVIDINASATIPTNGYILDGNTFTGGSTTYIAGLTHSSPKSYFKNNIGIRNTSDTGHATYFDTLHTVGSPQVIPQGVTPVLLTNNAGTTITSQLPSGATMLYNSATTKITPLLENDFNSADIMFYVKNSAVSGFFTIYIDIPTLGKRFEQTFICPKAANTEMGVNFSFHHYVSSQFATNGGLIYIVAESGDLSIYSKQYRFARLIKAQ